MKYKNVEENEDQLPVMDNYKMSCCDCGLVHDMDFQVVKIMKEYKDGSYLLKELPKDKYRVSLKARRNNRSTGQARRHRGITVKHPKG